MSAEAYAALGLPPTATSSDVRRAFRRLVLELHPDRSRDRSGDLPGAEQAGDETRLLAAIAAYEHLTGKVRPRPRRRRPSGRPERARQAFVRDRYNCGGCGDTFGIEGACPRCELPLSETMTPAEPPRPGVEAFIERLSAPPSWLEQKLALHQDRVPVVALGGLFLFGTFALSIHAPIAFMAIGYGLTLFAAEAVAGRTAA